MAHPQLNNGIYECSESSLIKTLLKHIAASTQRSQQFLIQSQMWFFIASLKYCEGDFVLSRVVYTKPTWLAGWLRCALPFLCPDWLNGIALVFTQVNHSFSWVVVVTVDVSGIFVYIFQLGFSSSSSSVYFFERWFAQCRCIFQSFRFPKSFVKNGIIYEPSFCWFAPRANHRIQKKIARTMNNTEERNLM